MGFFILLKRKGLMKKIFIMFISLVFMPSVLAVSGEYLSQKPYYICSGKDMFPIHTFKIEGLDGYFLNLSLDYNLDFSDYYEIDIENTSFTKNIIDITGFRDVIKLSHQTSSDYSASYSNYLLRILWEYLYPDKEFRYCSNPNDTYNLYYNTYERVKNILDTIIKGIYINNTVIELKSGQDYVLAFEYFNLFEVDNKYASISENKLSFNALSGEHDITLKRKVDIGAEYHLYTDGTNYIIANDMYSDTKYNFKIIVDAYTLEVFDEEKSDDCFTITGENYSNTLCPSDDLKIRLAKGKYTLTRNTRTMEIDLVSDKTVKWEKIKEDDQTKEDILLDENTFKEDVFINEEKKQDVSLEKTENIIDDEKESEVVEVLVPDTFEFPIKITFILVFLGIYFVKSKDF